MLAERGELTWEESREVASLVLAKNVVRSAGVSGLTYRRRAISARAASRSRTISFQPPSSGLMGLPIEIVIGPGRSSHSYAGRISLVPRMAMGITGHHASTAALNAPSLNGSSSA
jgi:hypothetical protein